MTKSIPTSCAPDSHDASTLPAIIQGGMGVGVAGWRLARTVSQLGQLGVVAGTALDLQLTRQLQLGDIGGHLRRALAAFPYPEIAESILKRYFIPGGQAPDAPDRAQFARKDPDAHLAGSLRCDAGRGERGTHGCRDSASNSQNSG